MKGLKHKISAFTLAASMLLSQPAFAEIVYLAEAPSRGEYVVIGGGNVRKENSDNATGTGNADISSSYGGPGAGSTGSSFPYTDTAAGNTGSSSSYGGLVAGSTDGPSSYTGPAAGSTSGPSSDNAVSPGSTDGQSSYAVPTPGSTGGPASDTSSQGSQATDTNTLTVYDAVTKPEISAEAAVLYDAATGQILFEKNGAEQLAPASMTKLMTALLAVERLSSDTVITFNKSAVENLEQGATTAGMKAGDTMTLNDALHALLIRSACEVANAIGEAIAGSQEKFVLLMNQRATELGCTHTHFNNASGLNDDNHYTCADDMVIITQAALANDTIRNITLKKSYVLPATSSRDSLTITNSCKLVTGGTEAVEGYLGGKTGYTSKAGSCLSSEAEIGGRKFIATVLKAVAPNQYSDTRKLYSYAKSLMVANGLMSDTDNSNVQTSGSSTSAGNTLSSGTSQSQSTGSTQGGTWVKNADKMNYKKADGSLCTNEWLDLDGNSFFFDSDSNMCTGWKKFTNGSWYYFNPDNGAMVTNKWVVQEGKSYYLQSDGVMATNIVINGMYRVDENGVYVEKVG